MAFPRLASTQMSNQPESTRSAPAAPAIARVQATIDGRPVSFPAGTTILSALRGLGIHVPHLCHDDRIAPVGACRLCVVQASGAAHPVPSCMTALTDGMVVETRSPALETERRTLLELLAWRHPDEPTVENAFLEELRAYGLSSELKGQPDPAKVDAAHPHILVDMNRCIDCYACERICRELQGQFTWRIIGRGGATKLVPDSGGSLLESSCVSCGACVDACPTGALQDKSLLSLGMPTRWARTTCPYCGVGCEMQVGTRDGRIVDVRPARDAPVNKGHLCSKGRYAFDFVHAADRPTSPMIRKGGPWRSVSWHEAIAHIAERLRHIVEAHGPDAVGVLGSARATNEENYVVQKFARVVLGTNNVDCCARVCHAPSAAALGAILGAGAATNSFDDIERAKTILVCGSNTTSSHPIVGARIRQATLRGANLIVLDARRTELAALATVHLAPRPGTDLLLFQAMAHTVIEEELVDETFIRERVDGFDELRAHVVRFSPDVVAPVCDVDASAIRAAARLYAGARPSLSVHGLGLTEHVQGTETIMALINLSLLTGNIGRAGAGVNPLRGQNNVQGSAHMGCEPRHLMTGYVPLEAARARFEHAWSAAVPSAPGMDLMEMLESARRGGLRALWAVGYDVYFTNPDALRTREALAALELVIVQDLFINETAKEVGHVFLPAAASFEKDGTFMNGERRVQRVRKAVPPPEGARTDWEIVCDVARALGRGAGFAFDTSEQIWDEVRRVWPAGAGMSYARLDRGGLQWPCVSEADPGTAMLHESTFGHGPRARLQCIEPRPLAEQPSGEFPFVLITGRHLYQFNAGTMTNRTGNAALRPRDTLDVSTADATRLSLSEGEVVIIESHHGQAQLPVRIDPAVRSGELYATFHTPESFVNRLTGDDGDPITHTPELKRTAVRISRVSHESLTQS
jgi:formate dehydrogenase major subunit